MENCKTLSFFTQKGKVLKTRLGSIFAVGMMYKKTFSELDSAISRCLKK